MAAFDFIDKRRVSSLWARQPPAAAPVDQPGFFERAVGFAGGLFSARAAAPSPSGWALREEGNRDVTASYKELVEQARAGQDTLPDDARKYVYLNVPGLFTKRYPGYMDENTGRMAELGLDPRMVPIDTDASVDTNAETIREMILQIAAAEGRQVVLTGQSKGGVDIAAALARFPELREHVRAVVSMQAPYGGTPLASDIAENDVLGPAADGFIKGIFGGDPRALADLSYASRQKFLAEHSFPEDVPAVSLATTSSSRTSLVAPAAAYMGERYGLATDGLVPVDDQVLPGSDCVRLSNMDHAGSVMSLPGRGDADTPADLTQALLTLALRKANELDRSRR